MWDSWHALETTGQTNLGPILHSQSPHHLPTNTSNTRASRTAQTIVWLVKRSKKTMPERFAVRNVLFCCWSNVKLYVHVTGCSWWRCWCFRARRDSRLALAGGEWSGAPQWETSRLCDVFVCVFVRGYSVWCGFFMVWSVRLTSQGASWRRRRHRRRRWWRRLWRRRSIDN